MKTYALLLLPVTLIACGEKEADTAEMDTSTQDTATEDTAIDTGNQGVFILADMLNQPSGCSDFTFFDRNEDDTIMLEVQGQGLAESAHVAGDAQSFTYQLGELPSDFRVVVSFGTNLSYELCNDALDPAIETVVDKRYLPVNGTMTLTVTPDGDPMGMGDFPAELQVDIQFVDFCADIGDGNTHHEDCFNVDDYTGAAAIGWLPG